ncbi:MAG: RNA-binding S4 domain-containing protein [Clostridia bacterium]|nr:RNA-binding S4 domain-containing protein [Clostridia bacterium]MBR3553731.1 RNA-binding S4 domain-containing protein [Clostridia bacterium]
MRIKVKIAEKPRKKLEIQTPFIRLDSALKLSSAVSTGGQAKFVIQEGDVKVNREVCLQRGKKLRPGDVFEFEKIEYEVVSCM